jgi:hypothetical protein
MLSDQARRTAEHGGDEGRAIERVTSGLYLMWYEHADEGRSSLDSAERLAH